MLDPSHCLQTEGGGVVLIRVCVFWGDEDLLAEIETGSFFPAFLVSISQRRLEKVPSSPVRWASPCCSRSAWRPPCSSAASARCGWTPMRSTRSAWPTQVRAIPLARCETLSRSAAPAHQWHASVCLGALRFCDERRQKPVRCLWTPCGRRGNLAAAALWLISKGAAGRHRSTAAVCRCRCLSWGEGSARAAVLGSSVNMLGSETPAPAPAPASAPQQQRSQRGCARVKTSSAPRSSPPQLRAHPLLALSCSYLRAKHPQAEEGWFHHPEAAEGALARAHQRLG